MRKIMPGEIIPWGYGIAWYEFNTTIAVAMPIPINLLARALFRLYYWCVANRANKYELTMLMNTKLKAENSELRAELDRITGLQASSPWKIRDLR